MKILSQSQVKSKVGDTRTLEDFGKFLGTKPHKLGLVASLYPKLTATYLTESLRNIFYNEKKGTKYQNIDAMSFEWDIDNQFIKKVKFAAAPTGTGANFSDVTVFFQEKYYDKYDTFVVEGSRQQFFVMYKPIRKADNYWEYTVRIVGNDPTETVDSAFIYAGADSRWRSNYHPELSDQGYTKYQSNVEKHRNHMSFHRNDDSQTMAYALNEEVFYQVAEKGNDGKPKETYYKFTTMKKAVLESFLQARDNNLLFGKSNYDKNGKCLLQDDNGQDISMGDGIIPQIERYADKYIYTKLTPSVIREAMGTMRSKCAEPTGNQWMFICNEMFWDETQASLQDFLAAAKTNGVWLYSKKENGNVNIAGGVTDVGTTFDTYIFAGNQVTFKVDRTLSIEYSDRPYAVLVDLTGDASTNTPAVAMFTFRGADMITGSLLGLGGADGKTSGEVASPVTASKYMIAGYSGVAVFNPYRSYILEGNIVG